MHLLLIAALAASFQQQTGPKPRPSPVVLDSAGAPATAARDSTKHEGRRRPVTPELEATAFKDPLARATLLHARAARLSQDSALVAYDAMSYERISAGMGIGPIGRDRLLYRYESASRVRWQQGVGVWIDVKGARTAIPMVASEEQNETHGNVHDSDLTGAIPYYPGYEPLWVGGDLAKAQVDESELVNPIADGAEAYYTYTSGDSISWRLPDKRTIKLRELKIRPRQPKWNLSVGSLWFDTQSGQLVRAAYRLAVPIDIWQVATEEDSTDDVPGWVKGMLSPLKAELSAVAIEYGLHDGRFWLPRIRLAEGRADASFMHFPFKMEESFTYNSVNGTDTLPAIVVDTTQHMHMGDHMHATRDSIRAVRRNGQGGGVHIEVNIDDDTADISARRHAMRSQCDTSDVSTSTRSRFDHQLRVAVRVPCNDSVLTHSAYLPKSIYDPGEELFGASDLDELRSQALAMSAQAPFSLNMHTLPPPTFAYGPGLMRYNRVEGFSVGGSVDQQFGGGYSGTALARLGFADLEPNAELTLTRTNLTRSIHLAGYNHLVSASDWGRPLSFSSSFSALMFGRDEGFYYKASGAEIGGDRPPSFGGGFGVSWRAFVENERTAAVHTNFAVNGSDFPANIVAERGVYSGAGMRVTRDYGLDPNGFRLFTDARFEAAMGDSAYGRGALELTGSHGLGPIAAALTLSGGSSIGALPSQRRWYLGGSQTVRGQSPDTAQSGNAFWMARAELGSNDVGARPTIFGDLGWVGDRSRMSQVGRPMSGVGAGVSFLDGLFRFDVARGLYPRKQFRVDLYLESKF